MLSLAHTRSKTDISGCDESHDNNTIMSYYYTISLRFNNVNHEFEIEMLIVDFINWNTQSAQCYTWCTSHHFLLICSIVEILWR